LLPPSLHEFVSPGHMAHFVRDTVREALDLSATLDVYTKERLSALPSGDDGGAVAVWLQPYGFQQVFEELPRCPSISLVDELGDREFAGAVDADEQV